MRWNKSFLAVAVLALATSASAEGWSQLKGHSSAIKEARETVIKNPDAWRSFWKEHTAQNPSPLPEADFSRETVIVILAGQRMRGGCSVNATVLGGEESYDRTVLYQVREPEQAGLTAAMLTQPYLILKIRKPQGAVRIISAAPVPAMPARERDERNKLKLETGLIRLGSVVGDGTGFFDGR